MAEQEKEQTQKSDRLYWLKLKKDFFKRHDVKVIENMKNGKDYVLFYLKLLCESLDHNGNLRFSDTIPYDENMLSAITDVDIDIVRSAMKIFIKLNLIEILEDETIYMREVEKMAGSESKWAEIKRQQRAEIGQCPKLVQQLSADCPIENKSIETTVNSIDNSAQLNKEDKRKRVYNAHEGDTIVACRELCKLHHGTDKEVDIVLNATYELGIDPNELTSRVLGLLVNRVFQAEPVNPTNYIAAILKDEGVIKD